MVVPVSDQFVADQIKKYLYAILHTVGTEDENYVIDEILNEYDQSVRDKFKKAFNVTVEGSLPIEVSYEYPITKEQFNARYVVYRSGREEHQESESLGNDASAQYSRAAPGRNDLIERAEVLQDEQGFYVETKFPYTRVYDIEEISGAELLKDDDYPNRCYFKAPGMDLKGKFFTISYQRYDDGYRKDYVGSVKQISFVDKVTIMSISNSMDTLRCLDTILNYILVLMRVSNRSENIYYQLGKIDGGELGVIENNSFGESPVYQIITNVEYITTTSVISDLPDKLKSIITKYSYK